MLRHFAFFEELGRIDENDPAWRSVTAGLVLMRLVDEWIDVGPGAARPDAWSVSAVREAVAEVSETTPLRRILTGILDTMVASPTVDTHALSPRLMAYGQTLEYDAKWSLAVDVYRTIVAHTDPVEDADLAISAFIQLGFCLRTMGELDQAAVAYEHASEVAQAAGDMIGVLRGRLGDVKIAVARGNMPYAESILDETIARAQSNGLNDICGNALRERAYVAGLRGQHDLAVRYAYDALELTVSPRDRDRTLGNIATGFRYLGLADVARDAYLVLATTAQEQYVRWLSELNLMELAAEQGLELQFDKYRRDLESADFTPMLRITYLLHVGRGYHSLGAADTGIPYLERAIELASKHKLNQVLFEAEGALANAKRHEHRAKSPTTPYVDSSIQTVIDGVHQLKEMAGLA